MKPEEFQNDPLKFASLLAHQLQSPLNAVSAALQTVLGEYTGPISSRQRGSLERANERCDQAILSVRRMLAIIKAGAGQAPDETPAALSDAIRQVHTRFVHEAHKRDISIGVDLQVPPCLVGLGAAALLEVLGALVSNALKYTPDQGRVQITVGAGGDASRVRVSVADSGIGVPEQDSGKIFQPFFRSSTARQSGRPGVGLGLAFVKSVVEAAGGQVRLGRSESLGGAEFSLELAVVGQAAETEGLPAGKSAVMRVVIIGGVTAGPKAAAKIIRLLPETDVTIVEKGNVMSYAGCGLPYYVSGMVNDQKRLVSSQAGVVRDSVFFRNVKNVHVMNGTEAVEIDRQNRRVRVAVGLQRREEWLPYDKLVITTGASAHVPKSLRTSLRNVFTLHGMQDAEGIRSALAGTQAQDVVIVGGGLIGIEMTEALVRKGARVTIVETLPQILPILDADMALLVERHMESHGVRVSTGTTALSLEGEDSVTAVVTDKGRFPANLVILACGIRPTVDLAVGAGLELGETGAIRVDAFMRTSDPDIFAAGDCVETLHRLTGRPCYVPLGSTATKQGRVAAVNVCGGQDRFPGVLGSSICRVFDYTVARTGLGEDEARRLGHDVVSARVPGPDRAHFMQTAGLLLLKLIIDRTTRKLLGVQITGAGAADKRIDVAATALAAGLTVDDLANLDLCYGPSFSTAMDNILTAANVVRNKLDGQLESCTAQEVHDKLARREDVVFLDVRTPEEYERQRLPRSVLVPLGALRDRFSELPRDREIVLFCDLSLRAYEGALILKAAGFTRVKVMEGGMAMWPYEMVE
jgi:NADPH-dependent 2,4-dienoyl-CoA reductase/sulfur reductase-like enzyme/rhodanese-related sulfurtransferase/two-component sensor histidine kinase